MSTRSEQVKAQERVWQFLAMTALIIKLDHRRANEQAEKIKAQNMCLVLHLVDPKVHI